MCTAFLITQDLIFGHYVVKYEINIPYTKYCEMQFTVDVSGYMYWVLMFLCGDQVTGFKSSMKADFKKNPNLHSYED